GGGTGLLVAAMHGAYTVSYLACSEPPAEAAFPDPTALPATNPVPAPTAAPVPTCPAADPSAAPARAPSAVPTTAVPTAASFAAWPGGWYPIACCAEVWQY